MLAVALKMRFKDRVPVNALKFIGLKQADPDGRTGLSTGICRVCAGEVLFQYHQHLVGGDFVIHLDLDFFNRPGFC